MHLSRSSATAFFALSAIALSPTVSLASEDSRPEILIMDLQHSEDVKPDIARTLSELVTSEISSRDHVRTLAGSDIRNMLELEGEKQAMGCDIDASCLAEVANAMGARFVVFGRVSTLGGLIVLTLNLVDAERAQALARTTIQAGSLDKLVPELSGAVEKLLKKPLEIWAKEQAERAAKAAVVTAASDAERKAATEAAVSATADAERARTTTDVSKVEVAPAPAEATPVTADEGGGWLSTTLLITGGVGVVAAIAAGAFIAVSGVGFTYLVATDLSQSKDDRSDARVGTYALTGVGLAAATLGLVVGGVLLGTSFLVE
jgi:TolB-like protein